MNVTRMMQSCGFRRFAALAILLGTALLLFVLMRSVPAPAIDLAYTDTTIQIAADHAWTFYPGDCVNLSWEMEGIQSLYINDYGRIGRDSMKFCPAINATSPVIEVTAQNGIYRRLALEIMHLPDLIFYLFGFVALLGSALLSVYFLKHYKLDRPLPVKRFLIALLLLAALGTAVRLSPASQPLIDEDNGSVAVRFWAERDRIIFPHECLAVGWSVSGARSLKYQGRDVTNAGNPVSATHCAGEGRAATLEVTAADGATIRHTLEIDSLLPESQNPPAFAIWSTFEFLFGFIVFARLAADLVTRYWPGRHAADYAAALGCLSFVIALHLPLGFDSIAQWENWILHSYIEGGSPGFFGTELVSRFMALAIRMPAYWLSSESFLGYNLVNCLTLAGTTVVFYGILRLLGLAPLFAFLMALLFMTYPVNPMLLSLRSNLINFSRLSFFLAVFCMLDFKRNPRRMALAGCWIALLYNVSTYETAYPLILLTPLLWWLARAASRRNVILTSMWCLIPLFKGAHLLLLYATGRDFYQSGLLRGGSQTAETMLDTLASIFEPARRVISYSFVEGWQDALKSLDGDLWWGSILILLAIAGGVACYLVRQSDLSRWPAARDVGKTVLTGFVVVPVSAVALLWLPLYAGDLWRPYLYVPLGASIALIGVALAVTTPIRNLKYRQLALIAVWLALLIPALSRLQLQGRSFVESADQKARILHQVLEIAPSVEPTTQLLIVTPMENEALKKLGIFEFIHWDMINSAFYVLYGNGAPERAYFCLSWRICSTREGEETLFSSAAPGELLQRTLVFKLTEELALERVKDPVEFLALDIDVSYDPGLLYDPDAPLPPRAATMLGPALHR